MEKFYKKIKEENRQNRIWLVVWFVAVCSIILEMNSSKNAEIIIYVILLTIASYEYFMKYFFLFFRNVKNVKLSHIFWKIMTFIFLRHIQ